MNPRLYLYALSSFFLTFASGARDGLTTAGWVSLFAFSAGTAATAATAVAAYLDRSNGQPPQIPRARKNRGRSGRYRARPGTRRVRNPRRFHPPAEWDQNPRRNQRHRREHRAEPGILTDTVIPSGIYFLKAIAALGSPPRRFD